MGEPQVRWMTVNGGWDAKCAARGARDRAIGAFSNPPHPPAWPLQEQPERLNGIVKWFNSAKGMAARAATRLQRAVASRPALTPAPRPAGFGFITVEDSEDEVFVHQVRVSVVISSRRRAAPRLPRRGPSAVGVRITRRPLSACRLQSNIDTSGYRSLREGEEVEFDLLVGEDGKKKAFHVTGPGGASPLVSARRRRARRRRAPTPPPALNPPPPAPAP
jgi:cold shock CspA family protein